MRKGKLLIIASVCLVTLIMPLFLCGCGGSTENLDLFEKFLNTPTASAMNGYCGKKYSDKNVELIYSKAVDKNVTMMIYTTEFTYDDIEIAGQSGEVLTISGMAPSFNDLIVSELDDTDELTGLTILERFDKERQLSIIMIWKKRKRLMTTVITII